MKNITTETSVLSNGCTVLSEYLPYSESFALGITVKAGAYNNGKTSKGLAHALEHLLFKRTAKYTAREIAEKFESLGAFVNAYTSNEYTCFYVRALSYNYNEVFDLLSDLVLNTEFREDEVKKEKNVILQEISAALDDPEDFIFDKADELIFGDHPFGYSILGTKQTLKNITIKKLEAFKESYYTPDNLLICSVGNIKHNQVLKLSTKYFNHLSKPAFKPQKAIPQIIQNEQKEQILKYPVNMVHAVFGKRFDVNERLLAAFLSIIIGDGMSSRLYQKIRDEEGLAYSIYSSLQSYSLCGLFYIYSSSEEINKDSLLSKIEDELELISEKGISNDEFLRAKEQLKSGFALEMEDLSARMQSIAKKKVLYGLVVNINEIAERYDRITFEEVNDFAKILCNKSHWHKVLVLPED